MTPFVTVGRGGAPRICNPLAPVSPVHHGGSMDRSADPSPFAWIFGGAVALLGLGAVVSGLRRRNQAQMDGLWAEPEWQRPPVPPGDDTGEGDTGEGDTGDVDT